MTALLTKIMLPLRWRPPALGTLTARVAELRPHLPGLRDYAQRTEASPL
ncbi:hypothetical protein [Streptomyces griseoaurantiacus]